MTKQEKQKEKIIDELMEKSIDPKKTKQMIFETLMGPLIDKMDQDNLAFVMYKLSKKVIIPQFYLKEHFKNGLISIGADLRDIAIDAICSGTNTSLDNLYDDFIYMTNNDSYVYEEVGTIVQSQIAEYVKKLQMRAELEKEPWFIEAMEKEEQNGKL